MSGFMNPFLLWGLFLLSAPIIIHLLNKRRFHVHNWAAMEFLLQADVKNRRRLRIEDLILLLLRMGLIAAAVFLVARPMVEGWGGSGEEERTIIIDDSFSMEHRVSGSSALERAREAAVYEVQEAMANGMRVSVRRGTGPAREIGSVVGRLEAGALIEESSSVSQSSSSPSSSGSSGDSSGREPTPEETARAGSRLLTAIRGLTASDDSLHLAEALNIEVEDLEESRVEGLRALYLVSDFRRRDWFESAGKLGRRVREALERLGKADPDRIRLRFINVGKNERENLAVIRVASDVAQPIAGVPVAISVEVQNFGSREKRGLAGELEIGDPENPTHRIPLPVFPPIPPGETASVVVDHVFARAGEYPLQARIDEDRLAPDDRAFAVVLVRSELSVLLVDGDPGDDRFAGEAGFLRAALAPRGSLRTGIRPEVIRSPPGREDLKDRDVVVLLNCPEISSEVRDSLEGFVKSGGGLAFFLGNRVLPARYQDVLGNEGIFPSTLRSPVEATAGVRMHFSEKDHPALEVYRGLRDATVDRITAARYFDLSPGPGALVVASYADAAGTPAILERALGEGRTTLFNISADRDWTNWPTDPSYPVVLQEWVRHLAPRRGENRGGRIGEPIAWPFGGGEAPEVVDPRGFRRPAKLEGDMARFQETDLAGFYRALSRKGTAGEAGDPAEKHIWFARNRSREESDLAPASEGELRSALSELGIPVAFQDTDLSAEEIERGGDIWRWLALAAGLLLLVELGAASWFGRR